MNEIQTNCYVNTGQEIGINQYMTKMKRLLKKKSNLLWHEDFLQQNVCENISPLGLRIKLYLSSFQNVGPEFKMSWKRTLAQCSTELMKLLISQCRIEQTNLDKDILSTIYE